MHPIRGFLIIPILNKFPHLNPRLIKFLALKINVLLSAFFDKTSILLVDFKLEFGKYNNKILLADEISPDSCRLWDKKSKKSFDKDLFRENKGDLIKAYKKILKGLDRI